MNIQISEIDPNPFQVRSQEDPAHVSAIAESILRNGLLQVPTARKHAGRVQLAFGHTRLAAFRLLAQNDPRYLQMPLTMAELTDEQMFEAAVAENIQRRDLTPIELARAMQRYLTTFHKTSEQAGAFFHVSAETVRGTVRLLSLPEPAQQQVAKGALTIGSARKILTVQQAAPVAGEKVAAALAKSKEPEKVDVDAVLETLAKKAGVEMWHSYRGEPRGGEGLWPLAWKVEGLQPMVPEDLAKALGISMAEAQQLNTAGPKKGVAPDLVERHQHLSAPPACTACTYHVELNEGHYCGFKACHALKTKLWLAKELARLSQAKKMPAYQEGVDPDKFLVYESNYGREHDYFAEQIRERGEHLRLKIMPKKYTDFAQTDSPFIAIIDVSRTQVPSHGKTGTPAQQASRRAERKQQENSRQGHAFVMRVAAAAFAPAFAKLTAVDLLVALSHFNRYGRDYDTFKKLSKPKQRAFLRAVLAEKVLLEVIPERWSKDSPYGKGPIGVARYLQKKAKAWDVRLPGDWLKQAKRFGEAKVEDE